MSRLESAAPRWRVLVAWNVSVACLAASALVFSARWLWLGELAANFEWQLGWLTLGFAAALAALRHRRVACALAALGALHLAPEAKLFAPHDESHGSDASLRVVTANLLQPNHHYEEIASALRATDADVIAVVELSAPMRERLDRELSGWPHRVYSPDGAWSAHIWAVALYSKRPLDGVREVLLRECYAPTIEARVKCGAESLTLRVVHMPRPGEEWRVHARNEALRELATSFAWDERCVLLGDLNTTSSSPAFGELLDATHLHDSRDGFGRQPTWRLRELGLDLPIAIDHVLVGEHIAVSSRETFELPHSDHDGVLARLSTR